MPACPVCQNASTTARHALGHGAYPVHACPACGFRFLKPQPDDKVLAEIYNAHYFLGDDTPESEQRVAALKRGTARLYLDHLKTLAPGAGLKLLELGCGRGEFLIEAQAAGYDVAGIEYSPHAVESANQRLGSQRVRVGELESSDTPANAFDIVTFADVVEHVRDPLKFLACVHRVLKPGGLVYIVTPSLDSWSAKVLGSKWMEYKLEHLSYFGNRSITRALQSTGFADVAIAPNYKVLSLDYIAHHFKRFRVPVCSPVVGLVRAITPGALAHKQLRIVASGMVASARKASPAQPQQEAA